MIVTSPINSSLSHFKPYKFFFIPFLIFLRNQKLEPNFQHVSGVISRYISWYFFIGSQALFQKHAEFNKKYEEIFLNFIPVCPGSKYWLYLYVRVLI